MQKTTQDTLSLFQICSRILRRQPGQRSYLQVFHRRKYEEEGEKLDGRRSREKAERHKGDLELRRGFLIDDLAIVRWAKDDSRAM